MTFKASAACPHTVIRFPYKFRTKQQVSSPPTHTHNIIQINLCFRKLNMSQCLFCSWPLYPLLCAYLQGRFHILVQPKKISHCCHISNRHTQHFISNAESMQTQVYNLSLILNFPFPGKISYHKTTPAANSTFHKT